MKFNYDAYEKVYPRKEAAPVIDSAVDGYTPTADEAAGKEGQPEKAVEEPAAADKKASAPAREENPAQLEEVQPEAPAAQEDISQTK